MAHNACLRPERNSHDMAENGTAMRGCAPAQAKCRAMNARCGVLQATGTAHKWHQPMRRMLCQLARRCLYTAAGAARAQQATVVYKQAVMSQW